MAWTATQPVLLSPEAALGWEFWNRYRRQLPLILLATCLFPACCGWYQFSVAYSRFKESRIWEPAVFVMPPRVHIAIVLITLAAVPLIVPSFAPLSRHYLLPVDTGRLTRTRWLLGAMAAALQSAAAFGFARIITRSDWPIIDPTIYAVLVFAIAQWIAVRFRDRKFWIAGTSVVAAAAVIAVVVNHFRMQPTLEEPWQDFAPLTPSQLTGIVGAIGLLFRLTMWAAEGDRCQTRAMSRHAESATPTSASVTLRPFRSSFGSLLSWEWRRNGWLYPIAVALGTFTVYAVCTFLFARDYQRSTPETIVRASGAELIAFWLGAMVVGPYVLVFTTATGRRVMAGKGTDAWPLTLPLTNRQIGYAAVLRALLSILLASVLAAGISVSFEAGTQFWLRMIGESTAADRLSSNWASGESMRRLWTTGAFLVVAAYTLCGVMESAILTGRRAMGGLLHLVQIGLWLVLFMVQVLFGAMSLPDWLIPLVLACLSLAAVGAAWRLNEVDSRGIFLSAAAWFGTTELFDLLALVDQLGHWPERGQLVLFHSHNLVMIFLACSSTMLPIVLPPLAVRWNRSR